MYVFISDCLSDKQLVIHSSAPRANYTSNLSTITLILVRNRR